MIKAAVGNTALLGLEEGNITKLKQGNPILIKLKEIGLPDVNVMIAYRHTRERSTTEGSGNMLFVMLSPKGIEKLLAGEITILKLKELDMADVVIAILYGATHADITNAIEQGLGLKMPDIQPVNTKPI